jgi:uncharacterized protein (DUF1330 family)
MGHCEVGRISHARRNTIKVILDKLNFLVVLLFLQKIDQLRRSSAYSIQFFGLLVVPITMLQKPGVLRLRANEKMKTYLINHLRIPGDVPNSDALEYLEQVEATVSPFGGKWLAQGPVDVLEGGWPGAAVLMEFPNRDAALAWYNSAAYQAIRPLRVKSAISDLVLIDELPGDFTLKNFVAQLRAAC